MARKNIIAPYLVASAQSMAANFTTAATTIDWMDNVFYQINITTSDSTGTFFPQVSIDGVNYNDLPVSATLVSAAANDTLTYDLREVPGHKVRIRYASTIAGTGTCNVYIQAKQKGG